MAAPSSSQHAAPPRRAALHVKVLKGEEVQRLELPFRLLVVGDFTGDAGRSEALPVEHRDPASVTPDTFDAVLASFDLRLALTVADWLYDEDGERLVDLRFERLDDFRPEAVAAQVPDLARLLEVREQLLTLRERVGSEPLGLEELLGLLREMAGEDERLYHLLQRLAHEPDDEPPTPPPA